MRASCIDRPASCSTAGGWVTGSSARRAACCSAPAVTASTASACGRPTRRCRRRIGLLTCCSRCAPTSSGSPPSRTTPSRARHGGCGDGWRRTAVRLTTRHSPLREARRPMAWRGVIAGGGFGGLSAARRLERLLPPHSAQVTLVADATSLLYTPLLPGAASGTLEPRHVVVPLREELDSTDIRLGRVTGNDPDARRLDYVTPDGRELSMEYDQLVVALGSVSRVLPIPGLEEHGIGFKTISEAIALR